MPQSVTQTKIVRPEAGSFLPRPKLFDRFDELRDRAMLWVASPAGSGKTASVSSFLASRRLNCLWYRVDESDVDLATFFYFLGLAGTNVEPDRNQNLPLFTMEFLQGVPEFSCNFFDQLTQRLSLPAMLVFDNVHHVPADAPLHKAVIAGLNRLPPQLQVVMISREPPPAVYSRLRANRQLSLIGWQDLKLTREECEGMVRLRLNGESLSKKQVASIHSLTKGWAAGVQLLLLNVLGQGIRELTLPEKIPEDIFDYFAEEIYSQLDPALRHRLLRSSFLPWMTHHIAETVIATDGNSSFLDYLIRNNLFVEKDSSTPPIFRYHPLFQEFLLRHASVEFSKEEIHANLRQSAATLLSRNYLEEGVQLLVNANDWEHLAGVIMEQAPVLIQQGRTGLLKAWLEKLPEKIVADNPWLLFWSGVCCFPHHLAEGRERLEKAYALFVRNRDSVGMLLCCLSFMESCLVDLNIAPLEHWLAETRKVLTTFQEPPPQDLERRLVKVMFTSMLFNQPHHPDMKAWTARAEEVLVRHPNLLENVELASFLLLYFSWIGSFPKAKMVVEVLRPLTEDENIPPLQRLFLYHIVIVFRWFHCDFEGALAAIESGLQLMEKSGIKIFQQHFLCQAVFAHLGLGDINTAEHLLAQLAPMLQFLSAFDLAQYHSLYSMTAAARGDLNEAYEQGAESLRLAREGKIPFGEAACSMGQAVILTLQGHYEEAEPLLERVHEIGTGMGSMYLEFHYLSYSAFLALQQGEIERGLHLLTKSFALGRDHDLFHLGWWHAEVVSSLCLTALEAGIETDFVRRFIQKNRLTPKNPPVTMENWPWPVRIYTLGPFELVLDGKPFRPRKAPERALALLKALLALGGRQVPEMHLAEVLWPDKDGDMQYQTLKTTLHRLRKLLVVKDAVKHADRMVTLDANQCWVDAWAFERLDDEAVRLQHSGKSEKAMEKYARACRYYQGEFLTGEDNPYALTSRQRLKQKFIDSVEMLGRHLEDGDSLAEAAALYEKALHHAPAEERMYQRLMSCLLQQNRRADAAEVYKRCHRMLATRLGVAPSPAIVALYKKLSSDG